MCQRFISSSLIEVNCQPFTTLASPTCHLFIILVLQGGLEQGGVVAAVLVPGDDQHVHLLVGDGDQLPPGHGLARGLVQQGAVRDADLSTHFGNCTALSEIMHNIYVISTLMAETVYLK